MWRLCPLEVSQQPSPRQRSQFVPGKWYPFRTPPSQSRYWRIRHPALHPAACARRNICCSEFPSNSEWHKWYFSQEYFKSSYNLISGFLSLSLERVSFPLGCWNSNITAAAPAVKSLAKAERIYEKIPRPTKDRGISRPTSAPARPIYFYWACRRRAISESICNGA